MKNILVSLFLSVNCFHFNQLSAQFHPTVDIAVPRKEFRTEYLDLGGVNRQGREIEVNDYFFTIDGKPAIPVTGEFHFSRYPDRYWREELLKMRAGGITIIATYVFWNIHEEIEGQFQWQGPKNLRRFVQLCDSLDFDVIVRIGPFCHGEIRNGGLPDWLLAKPLIIRSNDPLYLGDVEKLYNQIGQQLKGLLFKDGGPVIAVQLENEYQHSAAPWGLTYPGQPHDWTSSARDAGITQAGVGNARSDNPYAALGTEHMRVLRQLALKAGIEVPVYTATGWGNAAIIEKETLPVTAAYPYPTWAPEQPSDFYLYTNLQTDPDYAPVSYRATDYPCFAAELGAGIQITYERRPLIPSNSLDPMINRFLGSGANGIGYYMYHGGSTPRGSTGFFSDQAIGCPLISYDFQAPLGEYGEVRSSFHRLKLIHFFLQDFGEILAPMQVILPKNANHISPENTDSLRFSVRARDGAGFIFMNNFQDHIQSRDKQGIQFHLSDGENIIQIPEEGSVSLLSDHHAILPFGLEIGGVHLNYATAQVLTRDSVSGSGYYVFFSVPGIDPEFSFRKDGRYDLECGEGCEVEENGDRYLVRCDVKKPVEFFILNRNGYRVRVLNIPMEMALTSNRVLIQGKRYLVFSEALVWNHGNALELISTGNDSLKLTFYPEIGSDARLNTGAIHRMQSDFPFFSTFKLEIPGILPEWSVRKIEDRKYLFQMGTTLPSQVNDLLLDVDYIGDTGMGFLGDELVADHLFNGSVWRIGLKRFLKPGDDVEMVLYFRPLFKEAPFLKDLEMAGVDLSKIRFPDFRLNQMNVIPEYKVILDFSEADGML